MTTTLFLEDLEVGQIFSGPARTITEADVVAFAGLSGDYNPIHTDAEFAKESPYGQRVVYGLLGLSVLTGLLDRTRLFSGSAIAMLGIRDWTFTNPVFIGDTVRLHMEIRGVRTASKGDRGVVDRYFELINQRDEVVQRGHIDLLIRSRSYASA
ncbi:MaoC family dehydratase N-terminal domain-containing protein [Rhodococcus rhodochrous]|uniref:MaoC/PaaZ C-terminal domain-containing protein n=1 Tax=Rhodococcus rhodochrous TaxID=1829 RepID=UPI001E348F6A|nr:MaoC/PaaZ C-terminal domain-containing protein [Rhodococcus rhodochrous]MCB8913987.1 MaoC family dehydratase N-terminal domain-containing protein [Rhodococcus rhodochrous]